jgi:hypothetical protein
LSGLSVGRRALTAGAGRAGFEGMPPRQTREQSIRGGAR